MPLLRILARGVRWIRDQNVDWRVEVASVALFSLLFFLVSLAAFGDTASLGTVSLMTSILGAIVGSVVAAALTNATRSLWRKVRR